MDPSLLAAGSKPNKPNSAEHTEFIIQNESLPILKFNQYGDMLFVWSTTVQTGFYYNSHVNPFTGVGLNPG